MLLGASLLPELLEARPANLPSGERLYWGNAASRKELRLPSLSSLIEDCALLLAWHVTLQLDWQQASLSLLAIYTSKMNVNYR